MSQIHSSGAAGSAGGDATAEEVIAKSGLPSDVQAVIGATVRSTRLWKYERADVARELVAHFRDGLDRGETATDLVARFGEPKAAGRRMGKAAREKRHWLWHVQKRVGQGALILVAGLAVTYGALWIRFATGSPTIARNFAAELNAPVLATPESDRAWLVYRPAIIAIQPVMREHEGWEDALLAKPGAPEFDKGKAAVEAFAPQLATIRRAAKMPTLGYLLSDVSDPELTKAINPGSEVEPTQPSENPMLIGVLLQPLGPMRSIARALALDAYVAAAEGDGQRATEDIVAILGMARQTFDQPFLISDLVAAALGNLAWQTTSVLLERHPEAFTDAQLATLKQEIAKDAGDREFFADPTSEKEFMGDTLQRIYTDDGNGDGRLTPEGLKLLGGIVDLTGQDADAPIALTLTGPAFMVASPGRRETREQYEGVINHYVAYRDKPMWTWTQSPDQGANLEELKSGTRFSVAYLLTPALGRTLITGNWTRLTREATLTAISLEQFKRANGHYPAALSELMPTYLESVPLDLADGKPIRYRVVDGKPLIYSIGMDRVDNEARSAMEGDSPARTQDWRDAITAARMVADGFPNASKFDGDVVLWPRGD
jgi:hypothetical protein